MTSRGRELTISADSALTGQRLLLRTFSARTAQRSCGRRSGPRTAHRRAREGESEPARCRRVARLGLRVAPAATVSPAREAGDAGVAAGVGRTRQAHPTRHALQRASAASGTSRRTSAEPARIAARISAETATAGGVTVRQFATDLEVVGTQVSLAPMTFQLFGGRFQGSLASTPGRPDDRDPARPPDRPRRRTARRVRRQPRVDHRTPDEVPERSPAPGRISPASFASARGRVRPRSPTAASAISTWCGR